MVRARNLALGSIACLLALSAAGAQDSIDYRMLEMPGGTAFEDGVTPRARVRANYYKGTEGDQWAASPGQVSIEHGLPVWKDEYNALFESMPVGMRWRLGSNYWTNLFSAFPLQVNGKTIGPGYHYLVLERAKADGWNLVVLEPAEVIKRQLDPWHVNRKESGEGITILLESARGDEIQEALAITLKLDDEDPKKITVHIRFGGHHLWTPPVSVEF